MALPPLVTVPEFELRVPGGVGEDTARAGAVLADASAVVREEAEAIWLVSNPGTAVKPAWVTGAGPVPDTVIAVVCAVARRVFTNPEGIESIDYGDGRGRDYADATGDVFLKQNEKELLRKALRIRRRPRSRSGVLERADPVLPTAAVAFANERGIGCPEPYS